MARKKREKSVLGIYHVMLRGINKQDIFFKEDDMMRMMDILHDAPYKKEGRKKIVSDSRCRIYAYCILHNHIHILLEEKDDELSKIVQSIGQRYVKYYNKKHERVGHLFQNRFQSEAVNDDVYLRTVFRYIALNAVKAKEANTAEEYAYSSWNEYVDAKSNIKKVLMPEAIEWIKEKFPLDELKAWIDEANNDRCLDIEDARRYMSDEKAWDVLSEVSEIKDEEEFRKLDPQTQIYYLLEAIEKGVNVSQAGRLGTITYSQIKYAHAKKCGINSPAVPGTVGEKSVEQSGASDVVGAQDRVKRIKGLGKKTYHQLHLIVEYLALHSPAKCADVAAFVGVSNERTRLQLVLLMNENIVDGLGGNRNRTYSLKSLE